MKVKGCLARKVPKDMLFETVVICSVIPEGHHSDPEISFFQKFLWNYWTHTLHWNLYPMCWKTDLALWKKLFFLQFCRVSFPNNSSRNFNKIDDLVKKLDLVPFAYLALQTGTASLYIYENMLKAKRNKKSVFLIQYFIRKLELLKSEGQKFLSYD